MIDRNCDATILAGASDRRLASKIVDHARITRARLQIRSSDFDLGSLLHHDIPYLGSRLGIGMLPQERADNPHLSSSASDQRSIVETARHVMRSMAFAIAVPDNCLLDDPCRGNGGALLVDRAARVLGVERTGPSGPSDPLARHMLSSSEKLGIEPVVAWSPGWTAPPQDRASADHDAYSRRMHMLDDRQLASELLEQARDVRERYGIDDAPSPVSTLLWQTVPSMAAVFGMRMTPGEGGRFSSACTHFDDQRTFDLASSLVASTVGSVPSTVGVLPTIGDLAMFAEPGLGNSAAFLLDRVASSLGAERGGAGDPIGRAVAGRQGTDGGFQWSPDVVKPPRAPAAVMMAMRLESPSY